LTLRVPRPSPKSLSLPLIAALVAAAVPGWADAQDSTWREGVRITGIYDPGVKPGVLVLPVDGPGGDSLRAIIQRDFEYGHRMNVIALPAAQVPPLGANGTGPNYPLYVKLGADALVQITQTTFGIHLVIHNARRGQIGPSRTFPLPSPSGSPEWRLAVHTVADGVEEQLTSVRGIAATRILYASQGRIWQIDSDGANPTPVSPAMPRGDIAMSPAWHPRGSHIAYSTVTSAGHQVVIREAGGATRPLRLGNGLIMSPTFAPDGSTLVYAYGEERGIDLYAVNAFGSEPPRRITLGRGRENVSPSFNPRDGRQIAFTSDRTGLKNIYISDADGTNAEPLVPGIGDQSYRSDPDWSPDGQLIAFQSQIDGNFQLMTIGARDRRVRQLTSAGANETPSWAPDSRHLLFTSNRGGTRQIWIVDTESSTFRQLTHAPGGARLAAWSRALTTR
jgi:TolB protein